MAVRQLASVIPTASDIKFPQKASFGTAATKAETSAFGGTALTLGTFTLSAYMIGSQNDMSWELVQDVPSFQQTEIADQIIAQQMLEESYYVTGNGTGQPQGLIGNVGAGVTEEADSNGNLVSIAGTLDLIGTLNEVYHAGASWLMSREFNRVAVEVVLPVFAGPDRLKQVLTNLSLADDDGRSPVQRCRCGQLTDNPGSGTGPGLFCAGCGLQRRSDGPHNGPALSNMPLCVTDTRLSERDLLHFDGLPVRLFTGTDGQIPIKKSFFVVGETWQHK